MSSRGLSSWHFRFYTLVDLCFSVFKSDNTHQILDYIGHWIDNDSNVEGYNRTMKPPPV